MVNNKSIVIDLDRVTPQDTIQIHVNDLNSVFLYLTITKSGVTQDISGCSVEYDATLAGIVAEQDAAGSISSNQAVIPVTSNMVAVSGLLEIDVRLIEGTAELHTQIIRAYVNRSVIDGSASIDISGTTIYARLTAAETAAAAATAAVANKLDKFATSQSTIGTLVKIYSDGTLASTMLKATDFVQWGDVETSTDGLSEDDEAVPSSKLVASELAKKGPVIQQITINPDDWDENNDAYITVEGATNTSLIIWQYAPTNIDTASATPMYLAFVSATGRLRFRASSAVPTNAVSINLMVQN